MPLSKLTSADRMRLMRFVCSFAWADFEVHPEERRLIHEMVRALRLSRDERAQVERWLERPPSIDEVDPASIPREHRELFVDAVKAVIVADGKVTPDEVVDLALLEQLVSSSGPRRR